MAKGKASKAVATVDEPTTALALAATQDLSQYYDDAGAGFENTSKEDYSIPFVRLLQPTSPSVVDQVEGHKGGHWINTATGEVYPDVNIVIGAYERLFVEWVPRLPGAAQPEGSGFVAVYKSDDPVVLKAQGGQVKFGKLSTPNGNDLVETRYIHGIVTSPSGEMFEAVVTFASTHAKPCQNLLTLVRNQTLLMPNGERKVFPIYAHRFRLTSLLKTKANNKWFIPVPDWAGPNKDALSSRLAANQAEFQMAKAIAIAHKAGTTKVDLSQTSGDRPAAGGSTVDDADIPF